MAKSLTHFLSLLPGGFASVAVFLVVLSASDAWGADLPLRHTTDSGLSIELTPDIQPIEVGQRHNWKVTIDRDRTSAFDPIGVRFEAQMPAHGHGLPEPAIVEQVGASGQYLASGVAFNMAGAWEIVVTLGGTDAIETIRFPIEIGTTARPGTETSANEALMASISMYQLQIGQDASNRLSGNADAVKLGRKLFFEKQLSGDSSISCADCHQPDRAFTDGRKTSIGTAELARNAPTLLGVGTSTWFYSDGRRDSLWAQALAPLEAPSEMNSNRTDVVRFVTLNSEFAQAYLDLAGARPEFDDERRFPPGAGPFGNDRSRSLWRKMAPSDRKLVNRHFANVGKIIAAFEETLLPERTRIDDYVDRKSNYTPTEGVLTQSEERGLALFLDAGKTQCLRCHNGPLLTNQGFHVIGSAVDFTDFGFALGVEAAAVDPFNCTGEYSDDRSDCALSRMVAVDRSHYSGAFKVPTLRGISLTAPYFHDGRFSELAEVLAFYESPPEEAVLSGELSPLVLSEGEKRDLLAFLNAL